MGDREPGRRFELRDLDRVLDGDAEDPNPAGRPGSDPYRPGHFEAHGLQVVHPARLTLDVRQFGPHPLDRRVEDDEAPDGRRRRACPSVRQPTVDEPADRATDDGEPEEGPDHPSAPEVVTLTPASVISASARSPSPGTRSTAAIASAGTVVSKPSRAASSAVALMQ